MIAHMLKSITFVSAANFAWTAGERKRRLLDGKVTRVIMCLAPAQTISRARHQMETRDPMVNPLCARS